MNSNDRALSHSQSRELLPWYVNRTLEEPERQALRLHLEDCSLCREEVQELEELQRALFDTPQTLQDSALFEDSILDDALAPAHIDSLASEPLAGSPETFGAGTTRQSVWRRTPVPTRWLIAAQAAAIALLAALLALPRTDVSPAKTAEFTVLSDRTTGRDGSSELLRVVFQEDATEAQMRRLLRSMNAEIVAGPSAVGAYAIAVPEEPDRSSRLVLLDRMRADSLTRLVEPTSP